MNPVKEQFIVDDQGNKTAVIIDFEEYKKILEDLEELDSIHAYDEGIKEINSAIPFDQFISQVKKKQS